EIKQSEGTLPRAFEMLLVFFFPTAFEFSRLSAINMPNQYCCPRQQFQLYPNRYLAHSRQARQRDQYFQFSPKFYRLSDQHLGKFALNFVTRQIKDDWYWRNNKSFYALVIELSIQHQLAGSILYESN